MLSSASPILLGLIASNRLMKWEFIISYISLFSCCHSPVHPLTFLIIFYFLLIDARSWKNFGFKSPSYNHSTLDICFHIISSSLQDFPWFFLCGSQFCYVPICLRTFLQYLDLFLKSLNLLPYVVKKWSYSSSSKCLYELQFDPRSLGGQMRVKR